MFTFVRTRPIVSEDDVREALEEVEVTRGALDEVECHRPPFWGPPSGPALPLADLLRRDGPFAACWEAYDRAFRFDSIGFTTVERRPAGFAFFVSRSQWSPPLSQSPALHAALETCAPLAEEIRRQGSTPDRCSPYASGNEDGLRQAVDTLRIDFNYFARALGMEARYGEMPDDERLRLLVQGMAVARDLGHGASGFLNARASVSIEDLLAGVFVSIAEEITISTDVSAELHEALGVLADMPIDAHALLAGEGLRWLEEAQLSASGEYTKRYETFASTMFLSRLTRTCPPGATFEECVTLFPYVGELPDELTTDVMGPRFIRDEALAFLHAQWTIEYPHKLREIQNVRWTARALQEILRWSAERVEGRCPQTSSWNRDASEDRFYVDQNDDGVYRLVTPGAEARAFYFRCALVSPSENGDAPF